MAATDRESRNTLQNNVDTVIIFKLQLLFCGQYVLGIVARIKFDGENELVVHHRIINKYH